MKLATLLQLHEQGLLSLVSGDMKDLKISKSIFFCSNGVCSIIVGFLLPHQ